MNGDTTSKVTNASRLRCLPMPRLMSMAQAGLVNGDTTSKVTNASRLRCLPMPRLMSMARGGYAWKVLLKVETTASNYIIKSTEQYMKQQKSVRLISPKHFTPETLFTLGSPANSTRLYRSPVCLPRSRHLPGCYPQTRIRRSYCSHIKGRLLYGTIFDPY